MISKENSLSHTSQEAVSLDSLKVFLDQVEGFFFKIQFDKISKTYSFPFITQNAESLYGLTLEYLQDNAQVISDLIFIDDRKLVLDTIYQSMKTFNPWIQEFRFLLPSGAHGWVKIHATPEKTSDDVVSWNGYATDITEMKNTQLELLKVKERFEFALEGSQIGVWDWDIKNDKVFYSDKSLKFLEIPRDDMLLSDSTWTDKVHPDDKQMYFDDINDYFEGRTAYYSGQHRVFSTSGTYKWIQDKGKAVEWDKDGNPSRMIGTHVDITTMKEFEEDILSKNKLIESHNGRLKNFALIVSHNLRTHAGNLKSILELIDNAESPEEKKELAPYLNDISDGLSGTINNLNDIASSNRNLSDTPKLIPLRNYVDKTISTLQSQINKKEVIVVCDIPRDIQIIYNAAYLESILFNLLSNAVKYSDNSRQSRVTISAEMTSINDLTLSVQDNGLGLDLNANGGKLFGLYKTFHRNEDSKGLGLFMTKNQIEDMGDEISVESVKGEGSTFSVHFKNKLP